MSRKPGSRPHGQIRQSQLITSFGPGSMVDLPNHSVLIGGLDSWSTGGEEIIEPRLVDKLKMLFDPPLQVLKLFSPPPDNDDAMSPPTGITAWQFPEWFITQDIDREASSTAVRARMLVHRKMLTKGKFIGDDKKRRSVVPVRFVRACRSGHIGDIDWYSFVHGGKTECRRQLWIEERGTSGDLAEVYIRCDCGKAERSMALAIEQPESMLRCDGHRPWLGAASHEKCGEPNRLMIRTASNAYFTQLMSVISLPDRNVELREAVEQVWDFIGGVEDVGELKYERKKAKVHAVLGDYKDDEVFAEVKMRRGQSAESPKSIKQAEMETLIASKDELGDDKPDGNFFARTLPKKIWDKPWMAAVDRVVLVHRLREVMAQVGFTRFEAVSPNIDGELEMGVRRAMLAREITWLPAIENRGEGIFLQFNKQAVQDWAERVDVQNRGMRLLRGYEAWKEERTGAYRKFVEEGGLLPYVLFHSFSHMLITAISLECGYPASSIRERIYTIPDVGYGLLLYTGTSDAEGTLGGLIQVGRRIHEHIREALTMGELCSNDPVCAQHEPANLHERRFLHGAACHGCLLISETSCEGYGRYRNDVSGELFVCEDQGAPECECRTATDAVYFCDERWYYELELWEPEWLTAIRKGREMPMRLGGPNGGEITKLISPHMPSRPRIFGPRLLLPDLSLVVLAKAENLTALLRVSREQVAIIDQPTIQDETDAYWRAKACHDGILRSFTPPSSDEDWL